MSAPPVAVKICGIRDRAAIDAAAAAAMLGLVFYPKSPRAVVPEEAAALAAAVPPGIAKVGLFVDAGDDQIAATLRLVPLDLLQLHGAESPARAAAIRAATGLPVMKAIGVAVAADLDQVAGYLGAVDRLLFDAKPPPGAVGALPGGNGLAFDWTLIAGRQWRGPQGPMPWMLSGGLSPATVAEAIRLTGAPGVDVSSGVERAPGVKDPALIKAFISTAMGG